MCTLVNSKPWVMSQKNLRREYNYADSSDDEPAPVFVFDESAYGIKKKNTDSGAPVMKGKPIKAAPIDLDTSNVVSASKKLTMDAEE